MNNKVLSLEHLNKLIESGKHNFFIRLNGGLNSSKFINFSESGKDKKYFILNEIDDSEQTLSDVQLFDRRLTNIGDALIKGSLYYDD